MKSNKELLALSNVEDEEFGKEKRNARGKRWVKVKTMLHNATRKLRHKKIDIEDEE